MFITGVGTAVPAQRYSQQECWSALEGAIPFQKLSPRSQAILRKVLGGNNGIETRHLALDSLDKAFELTPDTLDERFARSAPRLASEAAEAAMRDAGIQPDAIDALVISTCTGYLCPGLTSYVSELLRLRPTLLALDLVGQGCSAALPNLCTAESLLESGRARCVLSVCVEVCSAAFYLDDDPGVLISACLFGDGAGAAVLSARPNHHRRMEWIRSGSLLQPAARDLLRFEQKGGMLRNRLSPQVPELAATYAERVLQRELAHAGIAREQVTGWLLHPGGRDVLLALRKQMGLRKEDLRWSEAVLREFGNLSSPSLFFVLQSALSEPAPGGYWWLSSFGAGFACHGALVQAG